MLQGLLLESMIPLGFAPSSLRVWAVRVSPLGSFIPDPIPRSLEPL